MQAWIPEQWVTSSQPSPQGRDAPWRMYCFPSDPTPLPAARDAPFHTTEFTPGGARCAPGLLVSTSPQSSKTSCSFPVTAVWLSHTPLSDPTPSNAAQHCSFPGPRGTYIVFLCTPTPPVTLSGCGFPENAQHTGLPWPEPLNSATLSSLPPAVPPGPASTWKCPLWKCHSLPGNPRALFSGRFWSLSVFCHHSFQSGPVTLTTPAYSSSSSSQLSSLKFTGGNYSLEHSNCFSGKTSKRTVAVSSHCHCSFHWLWSPCAGGLRNQYTSSGGLSQL